MLSYPKYDQAARPDLWALAIDPKRSPKRRGRPAGHFYSSKIRNVAGGYTAEHGGICDIEQGPMIDPTGPESGSGSRLEQWPWMTTALRRRKHERVFYFHVPRGAGSFAGQQASQEKQAQAKARQGKARKAYVLHCVLNGSIDAGAPGVVRRGAERSGSAGTHTKRGWAGLAS